MSEGKRQRARMTDRRLEPPAPRPSGKDCGERRGNRVSSSTGISSKWPGRLTPAEFTTMNGSACLPPQGVEERGHVRAGGHITGMGENLLDGVHRCRRRQAVGQALPMRYARRVDEPTWDQRILAAVPTSVDPTLVTESLRLTPTERLARLQAMMAFVELAHTRRDDTVQAAAGNAQRR